MTSPKSFLTLMPLVALAALSCWKVTSTAQPTTPDDTEIIQRPLELVLESKKAAYRHGDDISFRLRIKNVSDDTFMAWDATWQSVLVLDGKEYKMLPSYTGSWQGQGAIAPGGKRRSRVNLVSYGVWETSLSLGEHTCAYKIWGSMSNVVKITIVAREGSQPNAAPGVGKPEQRNLIDDVVGYLNQMGPDLKVAFFVDANRALAWRHRKDFLSIISPYLSGNDAPKVAAGISILTSLRYYGYRDRLDPQYFAQIDKVMDANFDHFYSLNNDRVLHKLALLVGTGKNDKAKERLLRIIRHPVAKSGKEQALICLAWPDHPENMGILLPFMLEDSRAARFLPYHFRDSYGKAAVPYLKTALSEAKSTVTKLEAGFELVHLRIPDGFRYLHELALKDPSPEGKRASHLQRIRQFATDYLGLPENIRSKIEIAEFIKEKQHVLCNATK